MDLSDLLVSMVMDCGIAGCSRLASEGMVMGCGIAGCPRLASVCMVMDCGIAGCPRHASVGLYGDELLHRWMSQTC